MSAPQVYSGAILPKNPVNYDMICWGIKRGNKTSFYQHSHGLKTSTLFMMQNHCTGISGRSGCHRQLINSQFSLVGSVSASRLLFVKSSTKAIFLNLRQMFHMWSLLIGCCFHSFMMTSSSI